MEICSKCENPAHARKLCKTHYQHLIDGFPGRKICKVESCRNISRSRRLCDTHYRRLRKRGSTKNPFRKGFYFNRDGYKILILLDGERIFEHRHVMESILRRKLLRDEVVHHINGIRIDNRPENLIVMKRGPHTIHHHTKNRICRIKGCGKHHQAKGFCNIHYLRAYYRNRK